MFHSHCQTNTCFFLLPHVCIFEDFFNSFRQSIFFRYKNINTAAAVRSEADFFDFSIVNLVV